MIGAACIRRPVATLLLSLGVLLLGVIAYARLPIAALPSVDRPSISVYASLPGASPETMASSVGIPLERRLGIIPGIAEMASIATPSGQEIDIQSRWRIRWIPPRRRCRPPSTRRCRTCRTSCRRRPPTTRPIPAAWP